MKTTINNVPAVTKEVTRTITETVEVSPAKKTILLELSVEEAADLVNIIGHRNYSGHPEIAFGGYSDYSSILDAVAGIAGERFHQTRFSYELEERRYDAACDAGFKGW
jgi:hypothetical protein